MGRDRPPLHAVKPPPNYLGRALPSSLPTEEAVLAAVVHLDAFDRVAAVLDEEAFYSDTHRRIWRACVDLRSAGQPIDLITLPARVRERGDLQNVGGVAYFAKLVEVTPVPVHLDAYVATLADLRTKREVAVLVQLAAAKATLGDGDTEQFLRQLIADAEGFAALRAASRGGQPHGFKLTDASAIFEPLPPPAYLVEDAIRRASLVLLGAYGSSGKTWIAVDLLVAVGTGGKWMGRFECYRGRAVFLDAESGDLELRRRIQAVTRARDVGANEPRIDICTFPDVYLTHATFEPRILALASHCDLIVIDSLAAMSPGVDENSAEMRVGLDKLRRVAEATGCVFVVLLHAKKTGGDPEAIDPRELFRGSSAIFDAADSAFAVVKSGDRLCAQQTKARHGREAEPFDVRIVDADGGVAVIATDKHVEPPLSGLTPLDRKKSRVLAAIRAKPGLLKTKNDVHREIGGDKVMFIAALDALVEDQAVALVAGAYRVIPPERPA